jgi:hypothetical protein
MQGASGNEGNDRANLLWFRWDSFFILSLCPSLDTLKVLADIFWEMESTWILSLQIRKKSTETTISLGRQGALRETNIAEPLIGERTLVDRGIDAFEVEGTSAAIATHQISIPTTRGAVIIVFVLEIMGQRLGLDEVAKS